MKASELIGHYQEGVRQFGGQHIVGSLAGENLEGAVFNQCSFLVDFKGANLKGVQFLKGNIKSCDFADADLTNAKFEYMTIEKASFKGSKANDVYFRENTINGEYVSQEEFDTRVRYL